MRRQLGGLLVMALGGALITTGVGATGATVGQVTPACGTADAGVSVPCPESTFIFDNSSGISGKARQDHAVPRAATPASWTVTITSSNCPLPAGSSGTVQVPVGGSAPSDDLYIYTSPTHDTDCSYNYVGTNPGFTATFDPAPPETLDSKARSGDNTTVQLFESATVTPTPTPSASASPTKTASPKPSATPTASSSPGAGHHSPSPSPSAAAGQTTPTLPNTGPAGNERIEVGLGVALCVVGAWLLLVGNGRRWRRGES